MNMKLFPVPRQMRVGETAVDLNKARWVRVDPAFSGLLKRHAIRFAAEASTCFSTPVAVTAGLPQSGPVLLTVRRAAGIQPQGYKLAVTARGITLDAADEPGAYYGLLTLAQMIRHFGAQVPMCSIADHPDFLRRGVMLDVSRCKVPTMASVKAYVDMLASLKINEFQLYMEHTFAFSAHEVVWHDASPFTAEEVLELDAYCRERYVELVPNFNSFGHFERWLRHPEYKHLAESPDGFEYPWGGRCPYGTVLKPDQRSLDLIDSLYGEFLPNFTSGFFNVGCDETWELGQGRSKDLCALKGKTRVYLDHLLKIHKLVRKHKRRMMFWGDIILHQPELIRELPKDIVAMDWGYESSHPFAEQAPKFADSGVPFYVCPGTSSWNSITGRTANCLGNLANAAENGLRYGAVGYLNTDWGDGGHHQYVPASYTGIVAGAAYSWAFRANKDVDVAGAMSDLVFHDPAGVLGELFFELGRVCEVLPARPGNSSVFNHLLFWNMQDPKKALKGMPSAGLRKCLQRFEELEERIAYACPLAADGELVKAELVNAIAMCRHGIHRALAAVDPKLNRGPMRRELQHVIGAHEDLWLARNRRGGLRESSSRLRDALAPLGG